MMEGMVALRGPLVIACDESGSEGERLIGGTTDVFAHASVHVDTEVAAAFIAEVRVLARSPATEVKASVILRPQNRRVLEWLLGPDGPISGQAHVHLTEKLFHLLATFAAPLGDPDATMTLYRDGPDAFGYGAWHRLLAAYNERIRARDEEVELADAVLRARLADLRSRPPSPAVRLLNQIAEAGPPVDVVLDPLVTALTAAVDHWATDERPVAIVHDIQGALTPSRIAELERRCGSDLASLTFVDSSTDPRVQVTDFLAGAARRVASEELNGRRDDGLAALLRPYVSASSIWAHAPSRTRVAAGRPAG